MRLTKEKAAENRLSILNAAGRLFRERGFDGVGLNDLMKAAGFTQGGFYNHFPSKEALAAESAAMELKRTNARLVDADLPKFLSSYLSPAHRDNKAEGCTLAALACDASRHGEQVQASFAEAIDEELDILAGRLAETNAKPRAEARERAAQLLSQLVGALILARTVAGANSSLSDEILQANRRTLET
ncbi:MAG TPA: TetR/AcrR family transcriptional regulator [Bryobacteraceae bacterium]|nr:TetR/AcrR family transcriptional regulator [Bryobacteraceae bacterium]